MLKAVNTPICQCALPERCRAESNDSRHALLWTALVLDLSAAPARSPLHIGAGLRNIAAGFEASWPIIAMFLLHGGAGCQVPYGALDVFAYRHQLSSTSPELSLQLPNYGRASFPFETHIRAVSIYRKYASINKSALLIGR